jgi:hypothetical protein
MHSYGSETALQPNATMLSFMDQRLSLRWSKKTVDSV